MGNISFLPVCIAEQTYSGTSVGVIFYRNDPCFYTVFFAFKIYFAKKPPMTAAYMAHHYSAGIIASAGFAQTGNQTFFGSFSGYFRKIFHRYKSP
jgi:hypothetical protein